MTLRGFLVWHLGALMLVGSAGASAYHALREQREAASASASASASLPAVSLPAVSLADAATTQPVLSLPPLTLLPAPPVEPQQAELPQAGALPPLRPHLAADSRTATHHKPHVALARHEPPRRPTLVAAAPAYPPPARVYTYPAYYPYSGHGYYPRYLYYRSF